MFDKTTKGVELFLRGILDNKPVKGISSEPATLLPILKENSLEEPQDGLQRMSPKGRGMLANLEDIVLTKYKDSVNVWTIGIGATRTEIPDIADWPLNKQISVSEAFSLFDASLQKYEKAVREALTVEVEQHVFDAMVSWCYNVGTGWCKKDKNGKIRATFIRLINDGVKPSDKRVYKAFMRFKKPAEIIGRRKKEAKLLTKGVYSHWTTAEVVPVSKKGSPLYSKAETIDITQYLKNSKAERSKSVDTMLRYYEKYKHHIKNHDYKVVIEMEKHSKYKRFFVLDKNNNIIRRHHVSHGVNSSCKDNKAYACTFSNVFGSRQSSLGAFVTGTTYYGKHGYSLNLHGLEERNNKAFDRRVVIHKASYVTNSYIKRHGRCGNSWGCPALDPAIYREVIDLIKNGAFLYISYKGD